MFDAITAVLISLSPGGVVKQACPIIRGKNFRRDHQYMEGVF